MENLAAALRTIADVDDDLGRRPEDLGVVVTAEAEFAGGDVHPAGHRWVIQLDPVLLALPLPRTLLLAAAWATLVDVVLPDETPEAFHDLLVRGSGLTEDHATSVVDLTVDLLSEHLGVAESRDAGLAASGHALAHADRILAGAAAEHPERLARAVDVTILVFDELSGPDDLAPALGRLGLAETAALVAAAAV